VGRPVCGLGDRDASAHAVSLFMIPRFLQRIRHLVLDDTTSYDQGLLDEAAFWRKSLANGGRNWDAAAFRMRMDPKFEFQPHLRELADKSPAAKSGGPVQVLDVGAGPLSAVGHHWPGREVRLTAVDPLADTFDQILAELDLHPPTRTRKASGEDLLGVFAQDTFDIVVCSNALDHSRDPLLCVRQMFAVTRPGGWIFLWHYRNEAKEEGYAGLHQWNLDEERGDLVLWNREHRNSTRAALGPAAVVDTRPDPAVARAIITRIHKRDTSLPGNPTP